MLKRDVTLLVVDDERAIRDSIVAYFEDSGYQVLEASNGAEGLDIFEKQEPDLVISDLRMPGLDGLQLLSRVVENSENCPVIVVSGAGVMTDVVEALRLGAADYLMKPVVDMSVLEHSVERALERSQLVKQNSRYRQQLEQHNRELAAHVDRLKLDLQAGRAVQQKLLPSQSLSLGQFYVTHEMQPSSYLSGDLVDYFQVNASTIVFYIADVSGHGASSALITLLIKTQIDRYRDEFESGASNFIIDPGQLLVQINLELLKTETGKHATMFYGVIDTSKNEMTYCSAAHFPSPILNTENAAQTFEPENLAVGLFDDADYHSRVYDLAGFRQLTLLSDGILELMEEPSLAAKEKRLLELSSDRTHNLLDYIVGLREGGLTVNAPDDITVLTVTKSKG